MIRIKAWIYDLLGKLGRGNWTHLMPQNLNIHLAKSCCQVGSLDYPADWRLIWLDNPIAGFPINSLRIEFDFCCSLLTKKIFHYFARPNFAVHGSFLKHFNRFDRFLIKYSLGTVSEDGAKFFILNFPNIFWLFRWLSLFCAQDWPRAFLQANGNDYPSGKNTVLEDWISCELFSASLRKRCNNHLCEK